MGGVYSQWELSVGERLQTVDISGEEAAFAGFHTHYLIMHSSLDQRKTLGLAQMQGKGFVNVP